MDERNALTVEDVARMLHVSKSGIYALIKSGAIGFYKVGRKIRFTEAHVRDYIERSGEAAHPAVRNGPPALDENRYFDLSADRRSGAGFLVCGKPHPRHPVELHAHAWRHGVEGVYRQLR